MRKKLIAFALLVLLLAVSFVAADWPGRRQVWIDCGDGTYAGACQLGGSGCQGFSPCF